MSVEGAEPGSKVAGTDGSTYNRAGWIRAGSNVFRPSERQKQIRLKLERSQRRWLSRLGEARLIWVFGIVVLVSIQEEKRQEPLLILLSVAIFAIAIFKHYFPTVSLHTTADGGSKPEPDQSEADEVVEGPLGELRATEQRMLETMASLQAGGPALIVMGRKFAKTRHRLLHRKPRRRGHES
jgi:hypothetical protein